MVLAHAFRWIALFLAGAGAWVGKAMVESTLQNFHRPAPMVTLETAKFYSRSLRKFSLGFDNLIADLIWVQLLQGASHEVLKDQGVSWEYAKLDSITTLDPKFAKAYWFGAAFLSVFRRDTLGAKDILEKWVARQPISWHGHYMLGFHLFHEMGDYPAAARHFLLAAQLPGSPPLLSSLGVRLMSERGGLFTSLHTAISLYDALQDVEAKFRLRARIRSLNYSLQKAQWKEALNRYRKDRGREPASLSQLAPIFSHPSQDFLAQIRNLAVDSEIQDLVEERFTFRLDAQSKTVVGILLPSDRDLEKTGFYRSK